MALAATSVTTGGTVTGCRGVEDRCRRDVGMTWLNRPVVLVGVPFPHRVKVNRDDGDEVNGESVEDDEMDHFDLLLDFMGALDVMLMGRRDRVDMGEAVVVQLDVPRLRVPTEGVAVMEETLPDTLRGEGEELHDGDGPDTEPFDALHVRLDADVLNEYDVDEDGVGLPRLELIGLVGVQAGKDATSHTTNGSEYSRPKQQ